MGEVRVTQEDREAADQLFDLIASGKWMHFGFAEFLAAHRELGFREAREASAKLCEEGYRCRTCDAIFTADIGHPEPACSYPNWDALTPEQAAAAIRALGPTD